MDHLAAPPGPGPGGAGSGGVLMEQQQHHSAAAYPFYSQQLASQYHDQHLHGLSLPPSSHLPSQYHATPTPPQPQQFQVDPSPSSSSRPSEPMQKVLRWQSSMAYASSPQQILSHEQQLQLHHEQAAEPYAYHHPAHPAQSPPAGDYAATTTRDMAAMHVGSTDASTIPRPRASTNPAAVSTPSAMPPAALALVDTTSHFQLEEPLHLLQSRTLHFHPPPQATAVLMSHNPSSPTSRTIDLNPSRTAARQASMEYGPSRRADSSSSSVFVQQHHPLSRQAFANANAGSSSSPNVSKDLRAADWDDTATPVRNSHARFQSASNVRGAPTDAYDGTPQKLMWDPHGRFATMESITSSQWSPVVNDMYRFIDPLRPNFGFDCIPQQDCPSPTKATTALPLQPRPSLDHSHPPVSLFSSVASGNMPSPPPTTSSHLSATSAYMSQHYPHLYQSATGSHGQPSLSNEYALQPQNQHSNMQPTQVAPPLSSLQQQASKADEDLDSRRASTSTSICSEPLVSPQDLRTDLPIIVNQIPENVAAVHLEDPVTQYSQEPQRAHAYRDYFFNPYDPSRPIPTQPVPYLDYKNSKPASRLPVVVPPSLLMSTSVDIPLSSQYPGRWEPPLDLSIAQLDRQTLQEKIPSPSDTASVPKEEVKRKRSASSKSTASNLKSTLSKPSVGQRSSSANETLKPAQERAYRRLSSPVLSVRPSDSGETDTFSDDDEDDDEDELADNTSTDRSQPGSAGMHHGSYTLPAVVAYSASNSASTSSGAYPSVYAPTAPNSGSSTSIATYGTANGDTQPVQQPAHPVPPPPDTSQLVRVVPEDEDDPDLGRPRRQKLRFADDWYTPEWVRGDAAKKEGFCDLCQPGKWLQLKNSAFWYHRQYTHGVSSVSGQPFSSPVSFRRSENDASTEALCHQCNEWVMYMSRKQNTAGEPSLRIPTNWFKHAHKCHFYVANRTKNDKPRGKRRKVSSSPDDDDL